MSPSMRRAFSLLKLPVAAYWVLVFVASVRTFASAFDAVLVMSAPLLLSIHFVQGLVFVRKLKGDVPWWGDFAQIMLFGVFHLVPLLLAGPRAGAPPER